MSDYVRGKGYPEIAVRDATTGLPLYPFRSLGDIASFEANLSAEKFTLNENISGLGKLAISAVTGLQSTIKIDCREWNVKNLAQALWGASVDVTGATISTAELLESGSTVLVVGDKVNLQKKGRITNLIVVDSNGTPATLALGTDYLHDGIGGITILNLGSYTQPFKATYTYAAIKRVPMLNAPSPDVVIRFWQKNTVDKLSSGAFKVKMFEFYRVQLDPTATMALLQDNDVGILSLNGSVLADNTKSESSTMSQYGNVYIID